MTRSFPLPALWLAIISPVAHAEAIVPSVGRTADPPRPGANGYRVIRAAYLAGLLPLCAGAQGFAPECPRQGTPGIVAEPARWADQCFSAVTGRLPDLAHLGETDSISRDIDLDGEAEHLEVRGTGNSSKAIYVFRQTTEGFVYLGQLNAHPSFVVVRDESGIATIEYTHRFGAEDFEVRRIQYIGNEFVEVRAVAPACIARRL